MVANGQLETPKSTIELKFAVGDIEFHEICIKMENLTGPIIGLLFHQRNQTVSDMKQGILNFPFFPTQLKSPEHRYSNVLEPTLNPNEINIPPSDRVLIKTTSLPLLYPEIAVTGILQPGDLLHEECDITFCPALVSLNEGIIQIPENIFSDHPYKLKKMTKNKQHTMLAVSSKHMKIRKTMNITGSLHQRILENRTNTRRSRKKICVNYRPSRIWRPLTLPKMKNLGQNS